MDIVDKIENIETNDQCVMFPGYLRTLYPNAGWDELQSVMRRCNPQQMRYVSEHAEKWIQHVKSVDRNLEVYVNPVGDVRVTLGKKSFMKDVKNAVNEMLEEIREMETLEELEELKPVIIQVADPDKKASERATIHAVARKNNIKLSTTHRGSYWVLTYGGRPTSKRERLLSFLDDIPYGVPFDAPAGIDDAILRVYMYESGYYASYRRGAVTKYRGVLRDDKLYVDGELIGTCKSRRMLEMLLLPMSLEPKHILNPRAPRIGSDSSCETLGGTDSV